MQASKRQSRRTCFSPISRLDVLSPRPWVCETPADGERKGQPESLEAFPSSLQ
jgi:hypothetical protein